MGKFKVVDFHHQAIGHWMEFAAAKPMVISLDHHTDVVESFARSEQKGNFVATDWRRNLTLLHHDEHFHWALMSEVISSAVIVAQENFTAVSHPGIRVVCDPGWPPAEEVFAGTLQAREMAKQSLESDFLRRQLSGIEIPKPYIFDIDLDYILSHSALFSLEGSFLRELVKNAEVVTLSREDEWRKILQIPGDAIATDEVIQFLQTNFH